MTLKEKVHQHCLQIVNDKINRVRQDLADLKESGTNETKSTAGDKHETALAMLQIEQANKREQVQNVLAQKSILEKIDPSITTVMVVNGSLIKTNTGYLYISVPLGKFSLEGTTFIALSAQSPLGKQLMGLQARETATVNNRSYHIESVE